MKLTTAVVTFLAILLVSKVTLADEFLICADCNRTDKRLLVRQVGDNNHEVYHVIDPSDQSLVSYQYEIEFSSPILILAFPTETPISVVEDVNSSFQILNKIEQNIGNIENEVLLNGFSDVGDFLTSGVEQRRVGATYTTVADMILNSNSPLGSVAVAGVLTKLSSYIASDLVFTHTFNSDITALFSVKTVFNVSTGSFTFIFEFIPGSVRDQYGNVLPESSDEVSNFNMDFSVGSLYDGYAASIASLLIALGATNVTIYGSGGGGGGSISCDDGLKCIIVIKEG